MQPASYDYLMQLRFNIDFATHASGNEDLFAASVYNQLIAKDPTVSYHDFVVTSGE